MYFEDVDVNVSSPRKRLKKNNFDVNAKHMILNIYKSELRSNPQTTKKDVLQMVTGKPGVSVSRFLIF